MTHVATLESISAARTQLDDLQAEMEAGARCAERLCADVTDERVETYMLQVARLHALVECADALRSSLAEQRTILRDLRASINQVRDAIRNRK